MALATRFYIPTIERVSINYALDAGSWDAAYPSINTLDNNLDSYAKSVNSIQAGLYLDTGDPTVADALQYSFAGVWVHNYRSHSSPPNELRIAVQTSANASFTPYNTLGTIYCNPSTTMPLAVLTFPPNAERYVALFLYNAYTRIEVSLAMIGVYIDLENVQWDWGRPDGTYTFRNASEDLSGGRTVVRNMSSGLTRRWRRRYEFLTSSQRSAIVSAHIGAQGRFQPFIIQDGTESIRNSKLVRFTHDEMITDIQVANGLWHVEFEVEEVPYIQAGYSY